MAQSNPLEATSESPNLGTVESCSFDLTRSNSDASSLTAENSKDIFYQGVNDKCMTWTNDMHNKYLDYLEASFVEHLQCPMGLLARSTEQNKTDTNIPQKLPANVRKASEQFTLLQDGQKKKINFQNDQPLSNTAAAESLHGLKLPWIHHLRGAGKDSSMMSTDPREHLEFHSKDKHLKGKRISSFGPASSTEEINFSNSCYQSSGASTKEGTGQNFVDEDCKERSTGVSWAKRLKTSVEDTSSKDQIVPNGKSYALEKSIVSNSTIGEAANLGGLSENFNCFVSPQSDVKSFVAWR